MKGSLLNFSPFFNEAEKIMGDNDPAVVIGIEGYQGIPKSDYSYNGAKLMAEYVKALGFKPRNIEILLDERATKTSIEKSIEAYIVPYDMMETLITLRLQVIH